MHANEIIQLLLIGAGLVGLVAALSALVRRYLHVCEPHEVLIFSGRNHQGADGRTVGYRIVHGGRAFEMPFVEKVDRMDISLISVPMAIRGAYSEGGIAINVDAIANIKVASERSLIGNAVERFLGRSRMEIAAVAKETLEGHLRGVLATMTPEEVNEDRLKFAERLQDEASYDLQKLGLQLDTLKIQAVSDDRNYLESLGRIRIAEILRAAEVAESDAIRKAEESEAEAGARGGVAEKQARARIEQKAQSVRKLIAENNARAKAVESEAEQAALEARAKAELELQHRRAELEELRLKADVTIQADVERRVREIVAQGEAAAIHQRGLAIAEATRLVAEAWKKAGEHAADAALATHFDDLVRQVTEAAQKLEPKEVSLVDQGDGKTLSAYASSYPRAALTLLDEVGRSLGLDLTMGVEPRGPNAARRGAQGQPPRRSSALLTENPSAAE